MNIQALIAVLIVLLLTVMRSVTGGAAPGSIAGGRSGRPGAGSAPGLLSVPGGGGQTASGPFGGPVNASLPRPRSSSAEPWKPGPGQLHGSDTSEWQNDAQFHDAIKDDQFAVIKASQGTSFVDSTFHARWKELGDKIQAGTMALRVAYCFLDKGDGRGQARHFLDVVGIRGSLPAGTRLALDWEAGALEDPGTLRDAGEYLHQVTGAWPIVYVQGSKVAVAKSMLPGAPLWQASWGPPPDRDYPFVQYSDGPVYDHDVFNGDLDALKRFAGES